MTTKTKGVNAVPTTVQYDTQYVSGNTSHAAYNVLSANSYKSTVGEETPNFSQRKKAGDLIAPTLFSQEEWECSTAGSWSLAAIGNADIYTADFFLPTEYGLTITPPAGLLQGWIESHDASVYVGRAVAGLYGQGFDGLTFIAEFRHIIKLFEDVQGRLIGMIRRHSFRDLANGWLELRYGWRLLIFDIESINKLINDLMDSPDYHIYTNRYGNQVEFEDVTTRASGNGSSWACDSWELTTKATLGLRGTAASKIKPPAITFDPIVTAWELLPWSFIIDWVFNVGDMLNALTAQDFHSDLVTSYGTELSYTTSGKIVNGVGIGGFTGHVTSTSVFSGTLTSRSPVTPDFIPSVDVRLSAAKVTDLAAILVSTIIANRVKRWKIPLKKLEKVSHWSLNRSKPLRRNRDKILALNRKVITTIDKNTKLTRF